MAEQSQQQDQQSQKFSVMTLKNEPKVEDVYGKAREFIDDFLTNVDGKGVYEIMGVQPHKTFLLEGQKGTGKSMAVQAINNDRNKAVHDKIAGYGSTEVDLGDFNILVFPYDIGSYGTAYINMSSKIIQDFFNQAGMYAQIGKPTMVVLDEADALLRSRQSSVQTHAEDQKSLETIMKNLQTAHDTPNMYVVLMTNYEEGCDDASLRAGRVDKKYTFKLPDEEERRTAFENQIQACRDKAQYNNIRKYNVDNLVELSEGFNYADIVASVENAVRERATEAIHDSRQIVRAPYVTGKRLEKSVKEHKESFVDEKQDKIGFGAADGSIRR